MSRFTWATLVLTTAAVVGCNTGSRDKTPATGTGTPGTGTAAALTVAPRTTLPAGTTSVRIGQSAVAFIATFTAGASANVQLQSVAFTASGTLNDNTQLARLALVFDQNGNGAADTGESIIAQTTPAFPQDNGTATLTANPAFVITASTSVQLLAVVTVINPTNTATDAAIAGKTVQLSLTSAGSIAAVNTGGAAATVTLASGTFPVSPTPPVTAFVRDHLLITEIVTQAPQYVEIFNPTADTIQLANYHLTDFGVAVVAPPNGVGYFKLPSATATGTPTSNFFNGSNGRVTLRFPQNAAIAPGAVQTIAWDGQQFFSQRGQIPTYYLKNAAQGSVQMRAWNGQAGQTFDEASLNLPLYPNLPTLALVANSATSGGVVILFRWNGGATPPETRVTDVDYVVYGEPQAGSTSFPVDKSSQTGTASGPQYPLEPNAATQSKAPPGNAVQRVNFLEGTENTSGGAGVAGHNEASENWATTFSAGTPTPNAVP